MCWLLTCTQDCCKSLFKPVLVSGARSHRCFLRYRHTSGASAVTIGVPFTLRVLGTFLREDDRYRVVTDAVSCGGAGAAMNAPGLAGDLVDVKIRKNTSKLRQNTEKHIKMKSRIRQNDVNIKRQNIEKYIKMKSK